MIASVEEFEITREQLGRAERALISLRKTVLPKNEARFRLMAEAHIEEIRNLRAEIDQYLGLSVESRMSG